MFFIFDIPISQGNTEAYQTDTRTLLDKVLNHDDSVNERYEGSKLHEAQVYLYFYIRTVMFKNNN